MSEHEISKVLFWPEKEISLVFIPFGNKGANLSIIARAINNQNINNYNQKCGNQQVIFYLLFSYV